MACPPQRGQGSRSQPSLCTAPRATPQSSHFGWSKSSGPWPYETRSYSCELITKVRGFRFGLFAPCHRGSFEFQDIRSTPTIVPRRGRAKRARIATASESRRRLAAPGSVSCLYLLAKKPYESRARDQHKLCIFLRE